MIKQSKSNIKIKSRLMAKKEVLLSTLTRDTLKRSVTSYIVLLLNIVLLVINK